MRGKISCQTRIDNYSVKLMGKVDHTICLQKKIHHIDCEATVNGCKVVYLLLVGTNNRLNCHIVGSLENILRQAC